MNESVIFPLTGATTNFLVTVLGLVFMPFDDLWLFLD